MLNDGLRQRQQVLPPPPAREAFRHSYKKDRNTNPGYYDWIVPFIPPVLRVNRDTRVTAYSYIKNNFHLDALRKMTCFLWSYKLCCVKILTSSFLWLRLLSWIHANAAEFANAFVIFSGLALIVYNCNSAIDSAESGNKPLSAYSIFNPNVERVLGSLTAEQVENEIRHRSPELEHENLNEKDLMAAGDYEDPELMRAIEMSLREAERQRDINKTIRDANE
uniref:Uncharacterized protein AlNc14C18G1852 n=1 Tax=Albugo laibachii Nc14 TaxID=890382 RepID=F0W4N1_9STRA|nr:conserved hypothetical protein [Albugo laibachii Nc14]|eukprot:CCA16065.1 conserved hypothetical protein [Albugo laibachii Nc14]